MKGNITIFDIGNGLFTFRFKLREVRDVIFHNGPYFLGSCGMYLNKWTLEFNLDEDVPTTISVGVKFPRLPFSRSSDECLRKIGNGLSKYIENAEPRGS